MHPGAGTRHVPILRSAALSSYKLCRIGDAGTFPTASFDRYGNHTEKF
jgi:hypothetical protein